ncbi:hypothetical protein CUMW_263270 [Citrus unshiu]|uniref:FBD domain-containing protein n=1 Tax=Citrus unshiu TaxID=55188 RepID=A0A2H5QUN5_CITUN|nr:hypothetical protein CUMW_263270 [Citrus unshiu]
MVTDSAIFQSPLSIISSHSWRQLMLLERVLFRENGDEPIKLPRSLVTCESLVSLKLDFGNREHQGVLNLPTCVGFSRLKSLDLQHVEFLNAILEQRSYFSASFNNLKSLILCVTTAEWTVPLIIRLLNHSPNLEVLTIYFDSDEYYDDWEIPDKVILCLTCHLKTVELIDFSGNENELELVRFLLKNGHVLQKLRVSWLERCGES